MQCKALVIFTISNLTGAENDRNFTWAVGLLVGLCRVLIRVVTRSCETREYLPGPCVVYLGLTFVCLRSKSWMHVCFFSTLLPGRICGPALPSIISGQVPANEQGELKGGLTASWASQYFGPILMTGLCAYFTVPKAPVQFAGAAFLLGSI